MMIMFGCISDGMALATSATVAIAPFGFSYDLTSARNTVSIAPVTTRALALAGLQRRAHLRFQHLQEQRAHQAAKLRIAVRTICSNDPRPDPRFYG